MATYIALMQKEKKSDFGVDFPDFPGCVTAGRTLEEARVAAVEALSLHIEGMIEDREAIPAPSSLDDIMADPANAHAVAFLVQVPTQPSKAMRINVMLPEDLVREIDRTTSNRSKFLAEAARAKLHEAAWEDAHLVPNEPIRGEAREPLMRKVNLAQAFGTFSDHWSPKIAGELNDSFVKLVKLSGPFEWHHHDAEDELFLVISGRLRMGLRTGDIDLDPGEFIIVPHGVEHRPEALTDECQVLLLEPKATLNTGNLQNERTVRQLDTL